MVNDLNLLHLWAAGSNIDELSRPVDDMSNDQFQDWLAMIGLGRTLQLYDDALATDFEDEFNDRLQKLNEFANEELADEDTTE